MIYKEFSKWFDSQVEFKWYPPFLNVDKLPFDELVSIAKTGLWDALVDEGYAEDSEEEPIPVSTTAPVESNDSILSQLQARATDLSRAITNPETLARKLREELQTLAGDSAITYHIGASYNSASNQVQFQIARLSPDLAIRLSSNLSTSTLQIAYTKQTASGWKVAVGLTAKHSMAPVAGANLEAEFSVTVKR